MDTQQKADKKVRRTRELLGRAHWPMGSADAREALQLSSDLKDLRQFALLADLSERVVRMQPNAITEQKVYVQALIETGRATAAIALAEKALDGLSSRHKEWSELTGLIGRAYKQIAIDTGETHCPESRTALARALDAYNKPYKRNPKNTWHAINLVAIAAFAKRSGVAIPTSINPTTLVRNIIATINHKPKRKRNRWDAATLAEAYLALHDLDAVEQYLYIYLSDSKIRPFEVGSTLRQFSEVWGLRDATDSRSKGLLQALRARLMCLPGAQLHLSSSDVALQRKMPPPEERQLEAILGNEGTQSYEWWKWGLDRACSVAAIYAGIGQRVGTGFAVSARDLKYADTDELVVVTNFHVVNEKGTSRALRPSDAQIVFEAINPRKRYSIKEIVWSSPVDRHDASILRLAEQPSTVTAIPLAKNLPIVEPTAKVYIIGHPGGGGLEFSFQDNALLDHEEVEGAKPSTPDVCRLHYRAPTEKGSSGSPVFNAAYWEGIALHHEGGILSKLNGQQGTYPANEGISLLSIAEAVANKRNYHS